MKRYGLLSFLLMAVITAWCQPAPKVEVSPVYRATPEKINDLVHTRLNASFDYNKSQLLGKVWITLKPHFYKTDSLSLDAKGMEIRQVALVRNGKNYPLKYRYDGMILDVTLDRLYKGGESYTIYIDYVAKPNEFEAKGSFAITDAKGMYFINPKGEEKDKPTQIWTQGETEATSVWVPTIDKPNQKTTQEFYLTVPSKYVSLSNGKLVSQKENGNGTRTDYWKMDLPHAPYLFMIAIGDFSVIKDQYKGKEVSYYVEKEYAPVARRIFGLTPEMVSYFSKITGVEYPWVKYAQVVVRDYVSGAMENTTATLHGESAQQDARELTDGNHWEEVIAHELFHQWFGDYITTESWSNITLNESFATIGSQLWNEYKYGKDAAYAERYGSLQGYYMSGENKDLVRFNYNEREDVFDAVSYNKGAGILQMLRNFVGDSAFFKSMNLFLNTNKFKAAEAHQLRLAFEEVTGKDLNWFFNQWYFGSGHPKLNIKYDYDENSKKAKVVVEQTQKTEKIFSLPVKIDLWYGNNPHRYDVWVTNKVDSFVFDAPSRPDLINFDADKILVAQKTENKTLDQYLHQIKNARNYIDRREAIEAAAKKQSDAVARQILLLGMRDQFAVLRSYSISRLDMKNNDIRSMTENLLVDLAQKDPKRTVKAAAISKLGDFRNEKYIPLFRSALNDSSYTVAGYALEALAKADSLASYNEAKKLAGFPAKGKLAGAITNVMIRFGDESSADVILTNFEKMPLSQAKFESIQPLINFLSNVKSLSTFKRGVDDIIEMVEAIPAPYRKDAMSFVESLLRNVQKTKTANGMADHAAYIESKFSKKDF